MNGCEYVLAGYKLNFLNCFYDLKAIKEQELFYKVLMVLKKLEREQKTASKRISFKDARQAVCPHFGLKYREANELFERMGRLGLITYVPFNGLYLQDPTENTGVLEVEGTTMEEYGLYGFYCEALGCLVHSCNDQSCKFWLACLESRQVLGSGTKGELGELGEQQEQDGER